jgi:hypothetical protein
MQTPDEQLIAFYGHHFATLAELAVTGFHIPKDDAESLAVEIVVGSLRHTEGQSPEEVQNFLHGAMTCAARTYAEGHS